MRLLIKPEHLAYMQQAINATLAVHNANGELVAAYANGEFPRSEQVQDLQKRFCFDVMYGAGLQKFVRETIYPYANDDHLYSALKTLCPVVQWSAQQLQRRTRQRAA